MPANIIQAPNVIGILFESGAYRQIFTDGRELPKDPNPTWWGYSVGHWEGGILVVQTIGFNDRSWLDFSGHPHTEDLRVTERFERRDFGHMQVLTRYAGNYEAQEPKMKGTITVAGRQLMFSIGGKGAVPLTTLSETGFYFPGGFPMEFVKDDKGTVTHFLLHTPCGDFKFVRSETAKP